MKLIKLFILCFVAINLSACGSRGKLKSPSQIEAAEAKKKAKAEKQADENDTDDSEETPSTAPATGELQPAIPEVAPLPQREK